jgi:hypothetical protein
MGIRYSCFVYSTAIGFGSLDSCARSTATVIAAPVAARPKPSASAPFREILDIPVTLTLHQKRRHFKTHRTIAPAFMPVNS